MSAVASMLSRYLEGESCLHRLDARVKLVICLGFIAAMTSLPAGAWVALASMILLVWAGAALSRLGLRRVFQRSLLAAPFVLIALPTVFLRPGVPLAGWDLGWFRITVSDGGLVFFASVMLKSWGSVTAAALLTATTPPLELLHALRSLRVPAILVTIIGLMYRYLFVILEEAQRLLRARSARSADLDRRAGGSLSWRARVAGGMAGSLFIRSLDRSERIYLAMLARGYDGQIRGQLGQSPGGRLGWESCGQMAAALALFTSIAVAGRVV